MSNEDMDKPKVNVRLAIVFVSILVIIVGYITFSLLKDDEGKVNDITTTTKTTALYHDTRQYSDGTFMISFYEDLEYQDDNLISIKANIFNSTEEIAQFAYMDLTVKYIDVNGNEIMLEKIEDYSKDKFLDIFQPTEVAVHGNIYRNLYLPKKDSGKYILDLRCEGKEYCQSYTYVYEFKGV